MTDRGIYPDALADRYKDQHGEKYRPSNGEEGRIFMKQWCYQCQKDAAFQEDPENADSCPIVANALVFEKDEPGYPVEWCYGPDGQPMCTAFEEI